MAPRRATFISYGEEEGCAETINFIKDSGVLLTVRDLEKQPFNEQEVMNLVGHLDIRHFLNKSSDSYISNDLDKNLPDRDEVIKMMADDYTLIRRPIIRSARLITIGCDQKRVSEMLQLGVNSPSEIDDRLGNSSHHRKRNGKKGGSGGGKK